MDKLRNYDIVFSGLKNGKHEFQFEIDKAFFKLFETEQEFTGKTYYFFRVFDRN